METTCRLCAQDRPINRMGRSFDDKALNIQQKLIDCCRWNTLCPIEYDTLPKRICYTCYRRLEASWAFAESVAQAQKQLISKFGDGKSGLLPIEYVSIRSADIKNELSDATDDEQDEAIKPIISNESTKTETPNVPNESNDQNIQSLLKLDLPKTDGNNGDDDEQPHFDQSDDFGQSESSDDEWNVVARKLPLPKSPTKRRYDAKNIDYNEIRRKRFQKLPGSESRLCDTCGMSFSSTTSLRRHTISHSDVDQIAKPLMCKTCGKRFRDNYNLKVRRFQNKVMKKLHFSKFVLF